MKLRYLLCYSFTGRAPFQRQLFHTSLTLKKESKSVPKKLKDNKISDIQESKFLENWNKINFDLYGPIIEDLPRKKSNTNEEVLLKQKVLPKKSVNSKNKGSKEKTIGNETVNHDQINILVKQDDVVLTFQSNSENHIPREHREPFIEKSDIILPFPMISTDKELSTEASKEIISLPNTGLKLPSVTQILSETMSESSAIALALWKKRKIAEVGEDGFKEFMREAKRTGKELHTGIETHLRGVGYDSVRIEPRISGHWLSLKSAFTSIKDVVSLESFVVHPQLQYKGCVDCVANHNGTLVAIDWKTSERRKNTLQATYDDPVQLAAYIGALNADPQYPFKIKNALLVVAYPTGLPADVLFLTEEQCLHYWQNWLNRLKLFNSLRRPKPTVNDLM